MPVIRTHRSVFQSTTSTLTSTNLWDHTLARMGINRAMHRVDPGLYKLGNPTAESDVFVTSNYTLSFDALRSALPGIDAYILVLDTFGVNVWCAAGKGTFGTEEVIHRVKDTKLADVVSRRVLILPQLGAPGVAAHEVKKATGFRVEYGPIRADDLPEYLKTHKATPEMRNANVPYTRPGRADPGGSDGNLAAHAGSRCCRLAIGRVVAGAGDCRLHPGWNRSLSPLASLAAFS